MEDGQIFLKNLCTTSFYKDLSNEPILSAWSIMLDSTFKFRLKVSKPMFEISMQFDT